MAGELRIKPGTKLRMALDVPIGQQPQFNLVCTFVKSLDVASFLISIPMRDGQPMPMDDTRKLLIRYGTDKDAMIVAGYADDVVKEGIRRCWKIRRVAEQRQFFQRRPCVLCQPPPGCGRGLRHQPARHRHRPGRSGHYRSGGDMLDSGSAQGQSLPLRLRLSVPVRRRRGTGADAAVRCQYQKAV